MQHDEDVDAVATDEADILVFVIAVWLQWDDDDDDAGPIAVPLLYDDAMLLTKSFGEEVAALLVVESPDELEERLPL